MTDKAEDVIDSLHEAEGLLGNECECMNHEDFCSWCSACKAVENARDLLASQAAEIDALREQLKQTQLGGALRDDYNEKRLNATIASQAAEIAALRADAERYRWLREYPHNYMPEEQTLDGDALDDAIDAALRGDAP